MKLITSEQIKASVIDAGRYVPGISLSIAESVEDVREFIKNSEDVAFDFETSGLNYVADIDNSTPFKVFGYSVAIDPLHGMWVSSELEGFDELLVEVCTTKKILVFNAQFELPIISHVYGVDIDVIDFADIRIYAFLHDPNLVEFGMSAGRRAGTGSGLSLKGLAKSEGWKVVGYKDLEFGDFSDIEGITYAILDVLYTYHFWDRFVMDDTILAQPSIVYVEHQVAVSTMKMMLRRITVDFPYLETIEAIADEETALLLAQLRCIAKDEDFNPASSKQLSKLLFETLGFSTEGLDVSDKTGAVSTGKFNLKKLARRDESAFMMKKLLRFREISNVRKFSKGVRNSPLVVDDDGNNTIMIKINALAASTGRMSCGGSTKGDGYAKINAQAMAKPSSQDIDSCKLNRDEAKPFIEEAYIHPSLNVYLRGEDVFCSGDAENLSRCGTCPFNERKSVHEIEMLPSLKDVIIARKGYTFVQSDYAQVEFRIAAFLGNVRNWVNAFNSGKDLHEETAVASYGASARGNKKQRSVAKTVNFQQLYGGTAYALAKVLDISVEEAEEHQKKWWAGHGEYGVWGKDMVLDAIANGYTQTHFGRRRPIPWVYSSNRKDKSFGDRSVVNTIVQGTSADITKMAIIRVFRLLKENPHLDIHPVLTVHDSISVEVRDDQIPDAVKIMEEALDIGLRWAVSITYDHAVGKRYGSVKDIDISDYGVSPSITSTPVVRKEVKVQDMEMLDVAGNTKIVRTGSLYRITFDSRFILKTEDISSVINVIKGNAVSKSFEKISVLYYHRGNKVELGVLKVELGG